MSVVQVVHPGLMATIQDLGRPGYGHLGVARSGAADRASLRLANRLVGNPESHAAIEAVLGGLKLRFPTGATFALSGAPAPATLGRAREVMPHIATVAEPGETLALAAAPTGLRIYVSIAGGIDVPPVLGSRSTDSLGGLGPAPLRAGAMLPIGPVTLAPPNVDAVPVAALEPEVRATIDRGPRDDMFEHDAYRILTRSPYTVTPSLSRVGIKLAGPHLFHRETRELRSEGLIPGAVQVPPSGQPIVLHADCPATGGYPVIAVVRAADLDRLAQLRPGAIIRFSDSNPRKATG